MKNSLPARAWGVAARNSLMALWIWAIVLVFAGGAAAPVYFLVQQDFGRSLAASGVGRMGYLWFGDVAFKYLEFVPAASGWVLVTLGLFLLVSIFLGGGILGRLAARERATFGDFTADCGRFFGRFLRVFLLSIPVYVVVFAGLFKLFAAGCKAWIERAGGEATVIIASALEIFVAFLLFSLVQMTFDFVKVHIVSRKEKRVLTAAAAAAAALLSKRFFAAWGIVLAGAVFCAAAGALFLAVTNILPGTGPAGFLPGFLLSQAFIWSRIWIRIFVNAMEIQFYERPLVP